MKGHLRRSTGMKVRRALFITATMLVLAAPVALAEDPAPPTSGAGRVCTLIGCESGVFFDAGRYLAAHAAVRVRVCALGRCRWAGRGDQARLGQPLLVLPGAREQAITITVTAFDGRGGVVLRRELVAQLRKAQPNGPECPPICFQASLLLSRGGALTELRR